jgi:hypothetical protein
MAYTRKQLLVRVATTAAVTSLLWLIITAHMFTFGVYLGEDSADQRPCVGGR